MGWKHYQTVDPCKREPQVARGLFGIRLLILHFKFQFSKSIKSSTFHIFLNLTYSLRKNISFPKCPKITQEFTQNHWYPSTNSSLQISIFQIHQIFNISYFPQFNLSFEKKYLFPKMPKNHPRIYTKPLVSVY